MFYPKLLQNAKGKMLENLNAFLLSFGLLSNLMTSVPNY